jgi:ketosteroid isomerase-like protein
MTQENVEVVKAGFEAWNTGDSDALHCPDANLELTGVFTVRKGRIFDTEFFWDHAEALEVVGLSE